MQTWPKHHPHTTLHEIILDGVARGFTDDQIAYETNLIATTDQIKFYRNAFNRSVLDHQIRNNHGNWIVEYPGDVFVVFDPTTDGAHILGACRTLDQANQMLSDIQ